MQNRDGQMLRLYWKSNEQQQRAQDTEDVRPDLEDDPSLSIGQINFRVWRFLRSLPAFATSKSNGESKG